MATIQLPTSDAPSLTKIQRFPRLIVQIKHQWSDAWQSVFTAAGDSFDASYLECLSVSEAVAPTIPRATFRYRAGMIKREDKSDFAGEWRRDLRDWFVRVQLIPDANANDPDNPDDSLSAPGNTDEKKPRTMFVGQFVDQHTTILGDQVLDQDGNKAHSGDQEFVAIGIRGLMARTPIVGSRIKNELPETPDDDVIKIDHTLCFNEKFKWGVTEVGNRSTDKYPVPERADEDPQPESYIFSKDDKVWTARQIVEYLLSFHGPKTAKLDPDSGEPIVGADGEPESTPVKITLGGQAEALDDVILPRVDLAHLNFFQALNHVIDPKRGLGWTLRLKDNSGAEDDDTLPEEFILHVFSCFDETIKVGTETVPANAETQALEFAGKIEIRDIRIAQDTMGRVGKIIVDGERVVSMFTISVEDQTIDKAWSDDAEDAYTAAEGTTNSNDAAANDLARNATRFDKVFTTFRIPSDWDWTAGGGEGTSSDQRKIVNPILKPDGTIDQETQASFRSWGHTFMRALPLRKAKGADDDVDPEHEPEYERPFVFFGSDRIDKNNKAHQGHVRMLDTELALEVICSPQHVLAYGSWTGAAKTKKNPDAKPYGFMWQAMIATVAVRTDVVARVTATIDKGDANRVVHIKVPDAELWYIVPNTITGIDAAGKFIRRTGKLKSDPPDPTKDLIVRDDTDRLRRVAALAKVWYGKQRSAVTMGTQEILLDHPVGSYVTTASDSTLEMPLNSVVTKKTWNFQNGSTDLQTDFAELDFLARDVPRTRN